MRDGTPLLDIKPSVPAFDDRPSRRLGGSPDVLTSSLRLALIGASNETCRLSEPPCPRVRCYVRAIGQTYNVGCTVSSHDSFAISVVRKTLYGVFA